MFFCKTNKGDGEVFQMMSKVGNVRAKTSVKKHLFEARIKFFKIGREDFLLLFKVGSVRANLSSKKHLLEPFSVSFKVWG